MYFVHYIINHWRPIVYLAGMVLEIIGTLLIANRYLNMPWWARIPAIISAIYNGPRGRTAETIARLVPEERTDLAIRGVGFLCLGFLLRTIPSVCELFH
jgi:hypothetical protein